MILEVTTKKLSSKTNNNYIPEENPKGTAIMPYTPGISEKLRRTINKFCIITTLIGYLHYEAYESKVKSSSLA